MAFDVFDLELPSSRMSPVAVTAWRLSVLFPRIDSALCQAATLRRDCERELSQAWTLALTLAQSRDGLAVARGHTVLELIHDLRTRPFDRALRDRLWDVAGWRR